MTAILKVDTIQDTAGNNIINESSDTITIGASGDTTNIIGTLQNNGSALNFATVNGITNAQQWRITAAHSNMDNGDHVTSNWEQADTYGYGGIGTAMSQSSGIFTFPTTGIWLIHFNADFVDATEQAYIGGQITTTTDNSSYNVMSQAVQHLKLINNSNTYVNSKSQAIFDVTNTTTHKVRFQIQCENNNVNLNGNSGRNDTNAIFIRLGDT
tara:strand:+ start:503 stop:1138 length:636 start_codon:yes stop_codon:yes gene_type:complete